MKKVFSSLLACMFFLYSFAQENTPANTPTGMNANGKIYVVLAVVLTVLVGLLLYVIRIDRKISKLEK
ncbi:CcmD family protein [Gynurincola endophyticus]|jgi:hypothetical protein|uniref:CcmD family protein n=1 Tax=Gynurincola endophyticus TaxID=2479004 RepID=UPI000F8E1540|nr:CcmD family protein [Gynurincola endophyticus]